MRTVDVLSLHCGQGGDTVTFRLAPSTHLTCRTEWHVEVSSHLACDTTSPGNGFPQFYRHVTTIFKDRDPTQNTTIHSFKILSTTYPVTRILDFTAISTSKLSKYHAVHLKGLISMNVDLTDAFI
jgi:hypothetical protein